MEFRELRSSEDKYWNAIIELYQSSFPAHERRSLKEQIEILNDSRYFCCAVLDKEQMVGMLFYWKMEHGTYVEHFAIRPELRGKRYGSKILTAFYQKHQNVILEIDPPKDRISIRRLQFYIRLGFKLQEFDYIHPSYSKKTSPHRLKIMTYPKNISRTDFNRFKDFLYRRVLKNSPFKANFSSLYAKG